MTNSGLAAAPQEIGSFSLLFLSLRLLILTYKLELRKSGALAGCISVMGQDRNTELMIKMRTLIRSRR